MAVRCIAALVATLVTTQTFITPRGEAQNVRFELRDEGMVHIDYDLVSSDVRAVFFVRLEVSEDGGATFAGRPLNVTGDVGKGVTGGTSKRIVWHSGKDVERVQIDRIRLRIVATGGSLQVDSAPPADPPPGPAPAAAPPPPKGGGGGSALKWILPLAAGGGVAGLLGARSGGSDPPAPPQPTADSATVTALAPPDGSTITATRSPAPLTARATVRYALVSRDLAYLCVLPAVSSGVCTVQPAPSSGSSLVVAFGVLDTTPTLPVITTQLRIIFGTAPGGGGEFLELRFPATFNWTRP